MRQRAAFRGAVAPPGDIGNKDNRAAYAGAVWRLPEDDGARLDAIRAGIDDNLDGVGAAHGDFIQHSAEGLDGLVHFPAGFDGPGVDSLDVTPAPLLLGFFSAWELKGRFPAILDDPTVGPAARDLYEHAKTILDRIGKDPRVTPRGVYGFWPANAVVDDIVVYKDDGRRTVLARFPMLRQQEPIADGRPNRSLADFVAPKESMAPDYIGAFAVTSGIGVDALVKEYEAKGDDYNAIIVKAIADRLAEAFAEYLHAQARKDWGYAKDESLSGDDLIAERYRGIRPAFGYPACL